jgi:hypothetical protein
MSNPIKDKDFGTDINLWECAGKPYLSNRTAEVRGSIPRSSTSHPTENSGNFRPPYHPELGPSWWGRHRGNARNVAP